MVLVDLTAATRPVAARPGRRGARPPGGRPGSPPSATPAVLVLRLRRQAGRARGARRRAPQRVRPRARPARRGRREPPRAAGAQRRSASASPPSATPTPCSASSSPRPARSPRATPGSIYLVEDAADGTRAAALQAGPERLGPRAVHRVHPADRRRQRGRATWRSPARCCSSTTPTRLPAGSPLPHQPRLRRAGRLPHQVHAGGADDDAAGQRDRRAPAHQLQAGSGRGLRRRPPTCWPRSSPTRRASAISPPRSPPRPPSRSRTAASTSPSRRCSRASCRPRSPRSSRGIPTTSGHSFRVADLTVALATAVDRADRRPFRDVRFSPDEMKEIRYASLLHDFGKVGVREEVLVKAKKLAGGPARHDPAARRDHPARSRAAPRAPQDRTGCSSTAARASPIACARVGRRAGRARSPTSTSTSRPSRRPTSPP